MKKLRFVFVMLALMLALAPVSLVAADAPVQAVYEWEESGFIEPSPCDFPVEFYAHLKVVVIQWLDQDGNVTHEKINWAGSKDTIFTDANEIVLRRGGQISFDYRSDNETLIKITGNNWTGSIPGYGLVAGSVGMSVVLVNEETGEETVLKEATQSFEDPEALCEYLQP